MRELSLHILDIIQNSISAQATEIKLSIKEDLSNDLLTIVIEDDGVGMDEKLQEKVLDPFVTSRTTRKVGLGLSLFKAAAKQCDGDLEIESELGVGTKVKVEFKYSHIDRAPLGDIVGTLITILSAEPDFEFIYSHQVNQREFILTTGEIKEQLGDVKLSNSQVINWLRDYLKEQINNLYGGEDF